MDHPAQRHPKHVVVIGAGIVGVSIALRLVGQGQRVTILDPGPPGGQQAASYGNGAFISPASIIPMSFPGLWRKVPGFLMDPSGPLTIRWTALPRLSPWLWRFLRAGATPDRVRRIAASLSQLLSDAPSRHAAQATAIGRPDLIHQSGLIYAFTDRAAFEADRIAWALRREFKVRIEEMEAAALHETLPDLSRDYRFAIRLPDGAHCVDPGGYVAAIAAAAIRGGATLHTAAATGFDIADGQLRAVLTADRAIACDAAVIACGARSKPLARAAGDRVAMESERGYHVEVVDPGIDLPVPVMPQDGRMANVLTRGGLRASGQVELASTDAAPDWRRADILLRQLKRTWPGLKDDAGIRRWQGNRPSTPDGMPVIGHAAGCRQIVHAFGHGHIGLASAPMTAQIVVDLIAGHSPPIDIAAFAADRFR